MFPPRYSHDPAPPILLGYLCGFRARAWRVELHVCATCNICEPGVCVTRMGAERAFPHALRWDGRRWATETRYDLPAWMLPALAEQQLLERALALWRGREPCATAA